VRSLALGEVEPKDGWQVYLHEIAVALINGLAIGAMVAIVVWTWQGSHWLALIVGVALVANIANAVTTGVVVPLVLRRISVDPALASGVIVMIADVIGFLIFLGLGTVLIERLE
jgi:magnesium transporter